MLSAGNRRTEFRFLSAAAEQNIPESDCGTLRRKSSGLFLTPRTEKLQNRCAWTPNFVRMY